MPAVLHAQWINSITIQPVNPTTNDVITVLADCSFPSGGCADHTQNFSILGNDITAGALHCLGPLSFICNYTDTFIINPLPAGVYTFHFQVDAGLGPSPCSPGIVPGPQDTIMFVVSPFTGIDEIPNQQSIYLFPNPAQNQIHLKGISNEEYPVIAEIISLKGEKLQSVKVNNAEQFIDISILPAANYRVQLKSASGKIIIVQFLKTK